MAINSSLHPLEQVGIPIGLRLPFSSKTQYFDVHYQTRDQLKDNLKNLVLTPKGFRPMNLDFGTDLYPLLFEQITPETIKRVRESILSAITRYIPQVKVNSLDVNTLEHSVELVLQFKIDPEIEWDELRLEIKD